jgi:uncharacterized membrane protein YbhN (UPF0104 family)
MAVTIYCMLSAPQLLFRLWRALSSKLPDWVQIRGETMLGDVLQALSSVRSPARLLVLLANSLLQWSLMAACVWMSTTAMDLHIGPAVTVIVLTATVVAVTLPNAPGYVGALQAAFVFALHPFGVSSESAFAASVFYLVGNWVPITATGGLLMLTTRARGGKPPNP